MHSEEWSNARVRGGGGGCTDIRIQGFRGPGLVGKTKKGVVTDRCPTKERKIPRLNAQQAQILELMGDSGVRRSQ